MANVGITYIGTNGAKTQFSSSSPSDAISRLNGIKGYQPTAADQIASSVATGWRERHRQRAAAFGGKHGFVGNTRGQKFASENGIVSSVPSVVDVSVKGESIVKVVRDTYVAADGTTVGIGAKREEVVGTLPKEQKVVPADIDGSVSVVVQTVYDQGTHRLYNVMGEIYVSDGKLCIRNGGEQAVTTAVAEST